MGATTSNTKRYSSQINSNIYSTPPKIHNAGIHNRLVQLQCDPRSPTDGISRTPIQIDSQLPVPPLKLYNHVMPHIIGPDLSASEKIDQENQVRQRGQHLMVPGSDTKRSSGVEPTLDPTVVLTAIVANNQGQLPPYQL